MCSTSLENEKRDSFILNLLPQVYKAWINCCLTELCDTKINNLTEDLQDGSVLCKLIKLTTGHEIIQDQPGSGLLVSGVNTISFSLLAELSLQLSPVLILVLWPRSLHYTSSVHK